METLSLHNAHDHCIGQSRYLYNLPEEAALGACDMSALLAERHPFAREENMQILVKYSKLETESSSVSEG